MIPIAITKAERELRRIIGSRYPGDVSSYVNAFGEIARQQVDSLPGGHPMRLEICHCVLDVLTWTRLMLQTRRAMLAEDLRLLQRTHRFLGSEPVNNSRFNLDL
jgi:hypothetical protein